MKAKVLGPILLSFHKSYIDDSSTFHFKVSTVCPNIHLFTYMYKQIYIYVYIHTFYFNVAIYLKLRNTCRFTGYFNLDFEFYNNNSNIKFKFT